MKKSNKAVVIGIGSICPKCNKEMERRSHPPYYIHRKSFYYTKWDYCKECLHVQHYDEFKSSEWQESERQESFFRDIR